MENHIAQKAQRIASSNEIKQKKNILYPENEIPLAPPLRKRKRGGFFMG